MHLENTYFMGRPEAIFDAAQQAVRMITLALKIKDGISDMLQSLWTCDGSFLGDMPDDKDGSVGVLCQLHQLQRTFTYLADAAWSRCEMAREDRLNGIHYYQCRFQPYYRLGNCIKLDGGEQVELFAADIQAFSTHFDLFNRLFAQYVEDRACASGDLTRDLQ